MAGSGSPSGAPSTPGPVPEGRPDEAATALRSWQLLDWRFLVPPELRRVGFFGPVTAEEVQVAREAGLEVAEDHTAGPPLEAAVVTAGDPRLLHDAASALGPDGWLLWRTQAARFPLDPGGPRRRRRRAHLMTESGTGAVRAYWHAPDLRRCAYIVELDDRRAVAAMVRRFHGVRLGLLKSLVARALNRAGLIDAAARDVTLVARLDPAGAQPPPVLPAQADALRPSLQAAPTPACVLMTPWFDASRHVLALYLPAAAAGPAAVAKLPRRAWDVSGIGTEARALELVRDVAALPESAAPRVLQHVPRGDRPFLLQSGVTGTAVGPEVVRRRTTAVLDAGTALIDGLSGGSPRASASLDRLVLEPLQRVRAAVRSPETARLVDRSVELLAPLRRAALPAVLEHGDLGHPNLILLADGAMAAIDWERFEPEGLPGLDLVFFLQYVWECTRSAVTVEAHLRAFDSGFTGPRAWAGERLRRYAARVQIPEQLLPCLVLATWCRMAGGLVDRLVLADRLGGAPAGPPQGLTETVVRDRDYALWRQAVSRFDSILA